MRHISPATLKPLLTDGGEIAFLDVLKSSLMPLRLSTLGELLVVLGNLLFLFNVGLAFVRHYRSVCKVACADATALLEPACVAVAGGSSDNRKLAV